MIRFASTLPLLTLVVSAPLVAQAARDFQLPPAATPAPDSRVQGPVDPDAPVPTRPRAIETARPAPTPAPTATTTPAIVLPAPSTARAVAQPRAQATRAAPAPGAPSVTTSAAPLVETPPVTATEGSVSAPLLPLSPAPRPQPGAAEEANAEASRQSQLPWTLVALAATAALAAAAFVAWRRRKSDAPPPVIVAPTVPVPNGGPQEALAIAVEAVRMDRSILNATVGYRVTIRNRTTQALTGLSVEADLVSASGDRPAEQQLASPSQALTPRHEAGRLAPGQSLRFEGQVRLPLSEASAIWQGRVGLLVPLLRVRATAIETAPVASTLVIGRTEGSTARPQPFRLDEPPRSYAPLAQRVLDPIVKRPLETISARA